MSKTLVIVESPAKARTIGRFLGGEYEVQASFGHIRDLPESTDEIPDEYKKQKWAKLGVNVEQDFQPLYVIPKAKRHQVAELRKAAKGKSTLLLATDEDREGESISWHILQVLHPAKSTEVRRIVFHEITPEAIQGALENPRQIDTDLFRAQEARRILDRLYGYTLSPLLWKKVRPKLSAGRVQSVAVRLVVMRERERRDFVEAEYWGLKAQLQAEKGGFQAELARVSGQPLADGATIGPDGTLKSDRVVWLKRADAEGLEAALAAARPWTVTLVETKPGTEYPPVPFMTSTLQQEANRKLGFTAKRTMQIAQQLYEGIDIGSGSVGLITYMRTDSLTLAERALKQCREVVRDLYGAEYLPKVAKHYKSKAKNAQEAHEAIRPTDLSRKPQDLKGRLSAEQFKLYELIWKRTLACQMKPAEVERTRVEATVENEGKEFVFGASGKRIAFPGFLRVYVEGTDDPEAELGDRERILPILKPDETLEPLAVKAEEHSTRPPARYTEATLVRKLEEEGVGRPSTYAAIISTIQDRGYVFERRKELVPTFTAFAVTELLEGYFTELVDLKFTARMEEELDKIAEGKSDPVEHLRGFYTGTPKHPGLVTQVEGQSREIPFPSIGLGADPETGAPVVVRIGRNGPFIQRGEGGPGNTASVPDDLPPAELKLEVALELLQKKQAGPEVVGADPTTGRTVCYRTGRFGDYLEVESTEEEQAAGEKPKRVTLPPGLKSGDIEADDLALLLSFPRSLGKDPESGEEIAVAVSRYGAYVSCGARKRTIEDWREAAQMDAEAALAALSAAPTRARATGKPEPLKEFGELEGASGPVNLMSGRYGPYVTDGKVNATLPKGLAPESLTPEKAVELIQAKAAAGPTKKRRVFRRRKS